MGTEIWEEALCEGVCGLVGGGYKENMVLSGCFAEDKLQYYRG